MGPNINRKKIKFKSVFVQFVFVPIDFGNGKLQGGSVYVATIRGTHRVDEEIG